jgi:hypothetical protein
MFVVAGPCWLMPVILTTWEAEIGRIMVRARPDQANTSLDPSSKITRAKCTGGVAQVRERLICK